MEQQKFSGIAFEGGEGLGVSVALSFNGNTALIGTPGTPACAGTTNGGAAVFVRTEGVWVRQQGLGINDCGDPRSFGYSVALSADGKVTLLGRPDISFGDGDVAGHAYVFVRNAKGVFVPQPPFTVDEFGFDKGSPIFSSGGESGFGGSVALSGDGRLMLIGGNHFDTGPGPVYVFRRSGPKWEELQKITPPAGVAFDQIALAADGKTALIGAPDSQQAYVLVRSRIRFREQQVLSGPAMSQAFGASVTITARGGGVCS